jgi:hypothetical protein
MGQQADIAAAEGWLLAFGGRAEGVAWLGGAQADRAFYHLLANQ